MVKMVKTSINGDWELFLPEHRAAREQWHTEEGWERKRLNSMYRHIFINDRDPDTNEIDEVVFYVGAEEGDMAALCALWGAQVVLFEPNDKVWPNIKAIWEANELELPYTFSGFASNQTTDSAWKYLRTGFPPSADGEVIHDHGFMELQNHNAPEIRIDDITSLVPTSLCIDVEGSEWEVLKGAEQTLKKHHPKIWLSVHPEFMFRIYEQYQFELRRWIKDLGYKETILDYQHELHLFYEGV